MYNAHDLINIEIRVRDIKQEHANQSLLARPYH